MRRDTTRAPASRVSRRKLPARPTLSRWKKTRGKEEYQREARLGPYRWIGWITGPKPDAAIFRGQWAIRVKEYREDLGASLDGILGCDVHFNLQPDRAAAKRHLTRFLSKIRLEVRRP